MTIGLVYFSDDPHQRVFRIVYPGAGDSPSILDDPKWVADNIPGGHAAAIDKVANANGRQHGTPGTAATDPIVYTVNFGSLSYTVAQWNALNAVLALDPSWPIVSLGIGDAATLTAGLIAPCIILVAISGAAPSIGSLTRTSNIGGQSVALWTA